MLYCFFFCKQKTEYEMRISDWSSDVCSSDLMTDLQARHETLAAALWPSAGRLGEMNGLLRGALLAFAGTLLLWACAKISIPIGPVPIAMTTFGVLAIGMASGRRDRKSTRLNSSHQCASRMPSSA